MEVTLSIDLEGKDQFPDASEFDLVFSETLSILSDLARASAPDRAAFSNWKISEATFQSPLHMTLLAGSPDVESDDAKSAIQTYLEGLRILDAEAVPEEPPPLFDEALLRSTKHMVSVLRRNTARITFSSPEFGQIAVTRRIAVNIDELIGVKFRAMGTLEGMLETLTTKGVPKDQLRCNLFDPISNVRIACIIPLTELEDTKAAFPMGRIAVYGEIRYAKSGRIISLHAADKIRRLRPSTELPQPHDLKGIDLTGGQESSEYIRGLRDSD
jgi:hypothetical protein